jgi:glycosyltransferase involved in cell wall biosynthesis
MAAAMRRLRIAQVAPPVERVPPAAYGGTERVVHELTTQLVQRGHDVTVFASGDSNVPGKLVPTVDRALRPAGIESDASGWFATTVKMVVEQGSEFDIIHSHLEWWSIPLARLAPVPVVATFHGRLDLPWADRLFRDAPDGMVAISRHQASTHPDVPWTIIHNGLTLDTAPFLDEPGDAFCFVGRVDAEKGIIEAIDIALRAGRRLRIAAKVGNLARQRDYYENVFRPALKRAGHSVEYLGELKPAERDQLFAESYGTLMPGAWPEPFGLVSIESLACGTPVLARRVGALPEIIREGVDGFFGDDAAAMAFFADRLAGLDRREIRERVIERFSAARMTDRYEELYARMVEAAEASPALTERVADAEEVAEALAAELPTEVTEPEDVELPEMPVAATATFADETDDAKPILAEAPAAEAEAVEESVEEQPQAVEAAEAPAEELIAEIPAEELIAEAPAEELIAEAPAEEPIAEAVVDEPAAEAPISAEAVAEEPIAAEQPIAAEAAVAAEPVSEEPIAAEAAVAEEPIAAEQPTAAEEPVAAEALAEPTLAEEAIAEARADEPAHTEPIVAKASWESMPDEVPAEAVAAEVAQSDDPEAEAPLESASSNGIEPTALALAEHEFEILVEVIDATAPIEDGQTGEAIAAEARDLAQTDEAAAEAAPSVAAVAGEEPFVEAVAEEAAAEEAAAEEAVVAEEAPVEAPQDEPPAEAPTLDKSPVAVGPGLNTTQPRAVAPPTPPAAKPPAKRPTKPMRGIFTRVWSGSPGKAASGRRRDRS